jgi:DNA topoisomerase I
MPRLRTVSPREPGWRRVRHGRGHRYLDVDGSPLHATKVEQVRSLVIPPAWRNVWISPHPNAHLQAVGTDEAGRRQYLYHPSWRQQRDEAKFDRVIEMAGRLPRVRSRLRRRLGRSELDRETALATAVRLVDLGLFRLGSDTYTAQNGTYGLTTVERRHVARDGDARVFCFVGKAGVEHEIRLTDPQVVPLIDRMTSRRPPDARVLSAKQGRRRVPLTATDINDYIRDLFGMEVSAKDFRTWQATVHVARWLGAAEAVTSKRRRTATVRAAVVSASELLGNTPTVCRSSYVDPRVIDLYESDTTIPRDVARLDQETDRARNRIDEAVVELLTD